MEFSYNSKEFNENIANVTRIIPDKLIPRDLLLKTKNIQKLEAGFNFIEVDIDSIL